MKAFQRILETGKIIVSLVFFIALVTIAIIVEAIAFSVRKYKSIPCSRVGVIVASLVSFVSLATIAVIVQVIAVMVVQAVEAKQVNTHYSAIEAGYREEIRRANETVEPVFLKTYGTVEADIEMLPYFEAQTRYYLYGLRRTMDIDEIKDFIRKKGQFRANLSVLKAFHEQTGWFWVRDARKVYAIQILNDGTEYVYRATEDRWLLKEEGHWGNPRFSRISDKSEVPLGYPLEKGTYFLAQTKFHLTEDQKKAFRKAME